MPRDWTHTPECGCAKCDADSVLRRMHKAEAAVEAAEKRAVDAEKGWRCFGCGFFTSDEVAAAVHFGEPGEEPAICEQWAFFNEDERATAWAGAEQQLRMERDALAASQALAQRLREVLGRYSKSCTWPYREERVCPEHGWARAALAEAPQAAPQGQCQNCAHPIAEHDAIGRCLDCGGSERHAIAAAPASQPADRQDCEPPDACKLALCCDTHPLDSPEPQES